MKKYLSLLLFAVLSAFSTLSISAQSGYDNGHRYIDLGLPSGIKWADCNIGASSPTDYGYYYAWGEISTKSNYEWSTYKYYDNDYLTKYCTDSNYGKNSFTDYKTELDLSDDVARQQWGGSWRMPSRAQFNELLNNTTNEWTTVNGVEGRRFTGKNGNSIFLPAAGYRGGTSLRYAGSRGDYWSRTLLAGIPGDAWYLYFGSGYMYVGDISYGYRYLGFTVRPVRP